jgi:hypothetical protein
MVFATGGSTERMRLDSSGNLGLGVTPSAWGSFGGKALDINGGAAILGSINQALLSSNAYFNAGWIYKESSFANYYIMNSGGQHQWHTAPSGTAGGAISFTQAMTLDASGKLGIGETSPQSALHVRGESGSSLVGRLVSQISSGSYLGFFDTSTTDRPMIGAVGDNFVVRTGSLERARITSGGDLLVGTTAPVSLEKFSVTATGEKQAALFKNDTNSRANIASWVATTTGDPAFNIFYTETSITARGSISYNRGAGLVAYNTTSDYRAKDISGPVTDSGAVIDSTPVYMGKMKGATQERPMFIAHETPAYAHTGEKDAVDADGNPVYQQMDASALIPVMWAEIQSLRARLAAANI